MKIHIDLTKYLMYNILSDIKYSLSDMPCIFLLDITFRIIK